MNNTNFDALTRQVGTIDRKTSLKMLGGSLAAVAASRALTAEGKKNKNNNNNNKNDKWKKKCKNQVNPCKQYWDEVCGSSQSCKDYYHDCCDSLKKCKGSQYFDCAFIP